MRYLVAMLFMLLINGISVAQVSFTNEASNLGIEAICGNSLYGSGVSFFDYDNDGWDDITLGSAEGDPVRFFKNINGNFVEQTLNIPMNNWKNKQVNWVDIDNDGDNDLLITSDTDSIRLYENTGNMIMQDITVASGLLTNVFNSYGASWGDYNNDGYLDIFISNYTTSLPNILYKNEGNNTFTIANTSAGIINTGMYSFCSAFFDYNNDGYQDIYVANDREDYTNTLYKNNGDGTFTDVSVLSGTNLAIDAMSVTIDDFNSDGWLDIYITNNIPGNVLLKNNGNGTFTDIALSSNTAFNSVGWGAVFLDADNDMDLDLYVSGEHDGSVSSYLSSAFYESNNDETFSLNNAAIPGDFAISYSNAIGDTDNDGYPEIVVNNINHDNIFLWKNNSLLTNNWLKVKLEGTVSNKNGIGSFIEISTNENQQFRYTLCGEGYLSQNSATEFFGLGNETTIDYIKVKWLSGIEDIIYDVNVNQQIDIIEGATLSTDNKISNRFRVYPNPVTQKLFIDGIDAINQLDIYSVLGQKVITAKPLKKKSFIDVSQLKTGVYFVNILTSNYADTIKIIKE